METIASLAVQGAFAVMLVALFVGWRVHITRLKHDELPPSAAKPDPALEAAIDLKAAQYNQEVELQAKALLAHAQDQKRCQVETNNSVDVLGTYSIGMTNTPQPILANNVVRGYPPGTSESVTDRVVRRRVS